MAAKYIILLGVFDNTDILQTLVIKQLGLTRRLVICLRCKCIIKEGTVVVWTCKVSVEPPPPLCSLARSSGELLVVVVRQRGE